VPEFLSEAWIDLLDEAATRTPPVAVDSPDADGAEPITIEYVVGDVRYHLQIAGGLVRFCNGPASEPTARFTTDVATAGAIARAELSAQRAFMAGRLRVGGDVLALTRAQTVLARLPDLFAAVRTQTTFPDARAS
jgi:hypothetical protein